MSDGALFETAVLDELLRWTSWPPAPPSLHFFRTHAGREVDFVLPASDRLLALEAKASHQAHPTDAHPLADVLGTLAVRGAPAAPRLGLVVTRGREVTPLARRLGGPRLAALRAGGVSHAAGPATH
jgi:hypothetical protein